MRVFSWVMLVAIAAVLGCGCTFFQVQRDVHNEDNPYCRDVVVKRIAIAPFVFGEKTENQRYDFDLKGTDLPDGRFVVFSAEIAREFGQELAQFRGFEVVPPADVMQAWQAGGDDLNPLASAESARALARNLKADAIIVGEVRSYDPYDYPRLELAWQVLYATRHSPSAEEIRRIERHGTGRPFPLGADYSKYPLYAADEVIDSRDVKVNASLEDYASSLKTRGSGYENGAVAIRKRAWPDYFRFASWYALRGAFDFERARR
ncbi:MAG: hypothetical protein IT462_03175 [Planctomycetes bacterium]|nr:hypothetical protein [Planctomycetota bacterium]